MESITAIYRRTSILDLFDQPFNLVHELYRNAFLTAQAQAEKDKKEKEERERKEKEEQRQARLANRNGGRPTSAIPRKQQPQQPLPKKQQTPSTQTTTPEMREAEARASSLAMDGLEDLFEEGF